MRTWLFVSARSSWTTALGALLVLLVTTLAVHAADWPQFRGPGLDGIAPDTDWKTDFGGSPKVAWSRDIGIGYSTVSVVGDKLFTAGWRDGKDTILALNPTSGEVIWEYSYPIARYDNSHQGGPGSTPASDGQTVWLLARNGRIVAVDARTGQLLWTKDARKDFGVRVPTWAFSGSPILFGDRAILLDIGKTVAFERRTGQVLWQSADFGPSYSSPVPFKLHNRELVAAFPSSGLVVMDARNGKELSKFPWQTSYDVHAAMPIVKDDLLFISSGYNVGGALVRLTDSGLVQVWRGRQMRNHMATCVLLDDHLYGINESTLACLDFKTGEQKWEIRGLGKGTVAASADKFLIILSDRGELVIAPADPAGFNPVSRAKVIDDRNCWVVPVLINKRLYCRAPSGTLLCLDVSK